MGDKRYFFSKEIATPERIAAREEKLGEKDRRERERESRVVSSVRISFLGFSRGSCERTPYGPENTHIHRE